MEIKYNAIVAGVSLVLAWAFAPGGDAAAKGPITHACMTEKCHAGMLSKKFVHGPVAVEDCLLCHVKTGEHSFRPAAKGEDLCYTCHERDRKGRNVDCLACHDPHGTDREFQLKPGSGARCKR